MTAAVRFKDTFTFRGWEGSNELITELARRDCCKPSEVVRQLVRAGLQARGIDPVQNSAANQNANPEPSLSHREAI